MSDTTATENSEVDGTETAETAPARVSRETARGSAPVSHLEKEGDIAADYLEGLLDIADLDGDIDMDVEGDRALVSAGSGCYLPPGDHDADRDQGRPALPAFRRRLCPRGG